MHRHAAAQALCGAARDRHRVALDHEVQLARLAAQQEVADGATDHVHGVLAVQRGDGGWPTEAFEHVHGGHLAGSYPLGRMSSDRPPWYRRRIVIAIGAVVAVLVCAAAVFALTRPGDVFNPDVEFRAEPEQTLAPTPTPTPATKRKKKADPLAGFQWAQYGLLA